MRSGQTARLPCKIVPASAVQSVNIQWTKDGLIFSDSRWLQQTGQADRLAGTLTCKSKLTHEHRFVRQQCVFIPLCFRYVQHSDGALTISSLKADDAGLYTCTASTQQQLEQRQLQLKVQSELFFFFFVYLCHHSCLGIVTFTVVVSQFGQQRAV